jgi:hypothetical protein
MSRALDLTGQRYGQLVVLEFVGRLDNYAATWRVRCDCGNERVVLQGNLRQGRTRSCGCGIGKNAKHGHNRRQQRTPEYNAWTNMKSRCLNPRHPHYKYYGGRGITVQPEWLESFEAFLRDVGNRPGPGYSLDRVDVDGNYEPGNVRWATALQQRHNRRDSLPEAA